MEHDYSAASKKPKAHLQCDHCGELYTRSQNLARHRKKAHGYTIVNEGTMKCLEVGCGSNFSFISDLRRHLRECHGFRQMKEEIMKFESYSDFLNWKEDTEEKGNVRFVTYTAKNLTKNGVQLKQCNMKCNRSGVFKPHVIERTRRLKRKGSSRCGNVCTAGIITTTCVGSEEVIAKVCLVHYGHEQELDHIPLSKRSKETIAGQLLQGVSINRILGTIRDSETSELTRSHLTTRKDLLNIRSSIGLKAEVQQDKNDPVVTEANASYGVEITEEVPDADYFEEFQGHLSSLPEQNEDYLDNLKQEYVNLLHETMTAVLTETDIDVIQLSLSHARNAKETFELRAVSKSGVNMDLENFVEPSQFVD